jgi:hypothetical protein
MNIIYERSSGAVRGSSGMFWSPLNISALLTVEEVRVDKLLLQVLAAVLVQHKRAALVEAPTHDGVDAAAAGTTWTARAAGALVILPVRIARGSFHLSRLHFFSFLGPVPASFVQLRRPALRVVVQRGAKPVQEQKGFFSKILEFRNSEEDADDDGRRRVERRPYST